MGIETPFVVALRKDGLIATSSLYGDWNTSIDSIWYKYIIATSSLYGDWNSSLSMSDTAYFNCNFLVIWGLKQCTFANMSSTIRLQLPRYMGIETWTPSCFLIFFIIATSSLYGDWNWRTPQHIYLYQHHCNFLVIWGLKPLSTSIETQPSIATSSLYGDWNG